MKFFPEQIKDQPFVLEGQLKGEALDVQDGDSIQTPHPVHAKLTVERLEGDVFLVRGRLETTLKLLCGRCAAWMDWPITIQEFLAQFEPPHPPSLDLTLQIREDILLQLPFNAVCRLDEKFRCPLSGKNYPPETKPPEPIIGKEVWNALDKLKIKE